MKGRQLSVVRAPDFEKDTPDKMADRADSLQHKRDGEHLSTSAQHSVITPYQIRNEMIEITTTAQNKLGLLADATEVNQAEGAAIKLDDTQPKLHAQLEHILLHRNRFLNRALNKF